ncbi:Topoisomerase 1-associated factor 1 [Rhizina undulata]
MDSDRENDVFNSGRQDVVDPMVLGGSSADQYGKYVLGDEALACLRDLKRWLKLYDEKLNRFDIARCMSEANLVKGDLLEILAAWKEEDIEDKHKAKLVLACVELIVPLTWPIEKNSDQMTRNHHRHIPVLQHAQAEYKKAILRHPSGKILKDFVRVALPSIAIPVSERSEKDEGIIRLVLYVLRNIAIIEHPNPTETDTGEEISRSATINAFHNQNVFHLLLAMASGMGDEFNTQDVVVMEVFYHILKGVDIEKLFMTEKEESRKNAKDLMTVLKMEDDLKRANARTASTRHNRFGTTVWMERDDGRRSFVSGQDALLGKTTGLQKLDISKKWKKPVGADMKGVSRKTEFDVSVTLEPTANNRLRDFVEQFLDSGFNPLFSHIRRAIDRDAERLLNTHQKQFFYLTAWFLKAERIRRNTSHYKSKGQSDDVDTFGLVAAVLNQESLITLNRRMVEWFDLRQWQELQAAMRCFTQILLTVHDMSLSPLEDDQEVAENIQNRLFYEETTLDLVISILRSYTKQPFKWLDDCTEMVHVHVKMLEKYSKQHEHMFIRFRRRQRAKKKQKEQDTGVLNDDGGSRDEADAAASKRAIQERSFDFARFEGKLLTQPCINTYLAFLGYYKELNYSQVKRVITFFHRIFVKREMEVMLFRLDIADLFYKIMQGSEPLLQSNPAYKEMDQFVKHYFKKLTRKLENNPALYVELLFTKINSTVFFLQNGYDKEMPVSRPRSVVELQVAPGMPHAEQLGVAVGVMLDDNEGDAVDWLKGVLGSAISERKAWEAENEARKALEAESAGPGAELTPAADMITPDSDDRKIAMMKDAKLRLLLTLLGLEKMGMEETPEIKWIIPSDLTAGKLQESLYLLKKYTDDPPVYDDGMTAEDFISRKLKPRAKTWDTSDDEGEDEFLFEPGGPTPMAPLGEREDKKKKLSKKRERDEVQDEIAEERRLKRVNKEKEKMKAIKSSLYVHDSDDESDVEKDMEFFARERAQREQGPAKIDAPLLDIEMAEFEDVPAPKKRKRDSMK